MRTLVAVLLALLMIGLTAQPAGAARGCRTVHGSGGWRKAVVTVRVLKGRVSCKVARRVARRFFSDRARFHQRATFAQSYWTVKGGWRGGRRMGHWVMKSRRRHARVGGSFGR
jgi:hypothetical protein